MKEQGRNAASESDLFDALERQREILHQAATSSKKARRKLARLPPVVPKAVGKEVDYAEPALPIPSSEGLVE